MTHEHEIAARAALADLRSHHERELVRIAAAIDALNGGPVVPMVRPPTPDVVAPPVVLPKPPVREQRPAAKSGERDRSAAAQKAAAVRVNCPDCGKECSQLGLGAHRRMAHHRAIERATAAAPTSRPSVMPVVNAPTGERVFACAECDSEFAIDQMAALSNHCLARHSRRPSIQERTPVAKQVSAA
jgi:type IV secretory pathway VirB10-like protein/DNA-directed RNA polymerase subunit RPC12/RpoP